VVARTRPATFNGPLRWDKIRDRPLRIFSCSLSDFFIAEADAWRDDAWEIIRTTPHLYMLLTKRPKRVPECLPPDWPFDNVELGVSVETPEYLWRIDELRMVEAMRIFVSAEPLLAKLSLEAYLGESRGGRPLDGVIAGGESGSGYRVMEDDWARLLRDECRKTNTAFFFKQHSAARPGLEPYLDGCLYQALPGEGFKEVVLDE
jgi:protein gp37